MPSLQPFRTGLPAESVHDRLIGALRAEDDARAQALLYFHEVQHRELHGHLGHPTLRAYAQAALGFSDNRFWQFQRLARDLERLPALRRAIADGDLGWTKAQKVARVATPASVRHWVKRARTVGRRQLAAEIRAAHRRTRANARDAAREQQPDLGLDGGGPGHAAPSRDPGPGPALANEPAGARGAGEPPAARATSGSGGAPGSGDAHGDDTVRDPDALPQLDAVPQLDDPAGKAAVSSADRGSRDCDVPRSGDAAGMPAAAATPDSRPRIQADGLAEARAARVRVTLDLDPVDLARFEALIETVVRRRLVAASASRADIVLAGLDVLSRSATTVGAPPRREAGPREPSEDHHDDATAAPGDAGESGTTRSAAVAPGAAPEVAPYTVVLEQCPDCERAALVTAGGSRPVPADTAEAMIENARVLEHGRMRHTVPPARRRAVLARDRHRCRMPGCGATRFLEIHHIVPRRHGGSHAASNLVTLCSRCHRAVHDRQGNPAAARALAGALAATADRAFREAARSDPDGQGRASRDPPA